MLNEDSSSSSSSCRHHNTTTSPSPPTSMTTTTQPPPPPPPANLKVVHYVEKDDDESNDDDAQKQSRRQVRKDEMWTEVSARPFNVTLDATPDMVETPDNDAIPRNSSLLDLAEQVEELKFKSIPVEALASNGHSPLLELAQQHVTAHTDSVLFHARDKLLIQHRRSANATSTSSTTRTNGDEAADSSSSDDASNSNSAVAMIGVGVGGPCFNPHDTHVDIVLSDRFLTVTRKGPGVYRSARANFSIPLSSTTTTSSLSPDKGEDALSSHAVYFEVEVICLDSTDTRCGACIGLSTPAFPLQNHLVGASQNSVGLFSLGYLVHNNDFTEFGSPFESGDVIGCLVSAQRSIESGNDDNIQVSLTYNINDTVLDTLHYQIPTSSSCDQLFPTVSVMGDRTSVRGCFTSDSLHFKSLFSSCSSDTDIRTLTGEPITKTSDSTLHSLPDSDVVSITVSMPNSRSFSSDEVDDSS